MSTPAESIIRRCQDPELGLSASPGGAIGSSSRGMSDAQVADLALELDYLARGEPDPVVRRRYNSTISFLREDLARRERGASREKLQDLAREARRTGRETCECGADHVPGASYYVSVEDGGRSALASGPYPTHAEALARVDEVRERAIRSDGRAHFYSWGTMAMPATYKKRGQLD